jgi:hypothetical protein
MYLGPCRYAYVASACIAWRCENVYFHILVDFVFFIVTRNMLSFVNYCVLFCGLGNMFFPVLLVYLDLML